MIRKDVVTLTFRALTEKRNREKWWNQSGNFFAALFLASIGMLIHMHFLWNHVDILVAAVLLVIVIKTVVVAVVVKVFPYNNRTAVLSKLYLCFWGQLLKAWCYAQVLMKIGVPPAGLYRQGLCKPALNVYRGGAGQVGIPSAVNEMVVSRLVEFPEDLVEEMSMTLPDMMFVDGQEPVEVRVLRA
ncbi:unnamed protein product [Brassica oleracea var. botrytis]|uniref:(rape) hypothetical protein n=1 Tax=Brassica napus TaxID=3708 RepID=A0A816J1F8_BRANA|nr:unnamed protein product [Brassica napus]